MLLTCIKYHLFYLLPLLNKVAVKENRADLEAPAMANCDPSRHLDSFNFVGSHLAQISKGNAFARIKEIYGLDGESVREREEEHLKQNGHMEGKVLKNITDYTSAKDLAKYGMIHAYRTFVCCVLCINIFGLD